MTSEQKIETIENDVLIVAVQDSAAGYFLWQKGLTKEVGSEDGVYFVKGSSPFMTFYEGHDN